MNIRIALPTANGRLHGHFGGANEFTLVDADREARVVVGRQVVPAPPHKPGLFPHWLREQGVQVVLAGGIGRRALDLFAKQGITVRAAQPDALVEVATAAYLTGLLTEGPQGCSHHGHHEHDHSHDHEPHHDESSEAAQ
jgi:ATP-binding protein involved in chromosome partitioning